MSEMIASNRHSPFRGVNLYHWMVVIIAAAGWLFDCMDQRIFVLAREYAVKELLQDFPQKLQRANVYGGYATTAMIIGWATGGIIFGILSDKIGRVKTMVLTLLTYSSFTGLSGIAKSYEQFLLFRFLCGLGVGGMFGAATSLVAESVPNHFRTFALGLLQALSALGNITGSLISLGIKPSEPNFLWGLAGWRILFFIGFLPALLVVPIMLILKEPKTWQEARSRALEGPGAKKMGSVKDLFSHKMWRLHALVGLLLGVSGMIGLWGIGFFSPELVRHALETLPPNEVSKIRSVGTALQDLGAFLGMLTFTWMAAKLGRRPAFALTFVACFLVTSFVFAKLNAPSDAYWMLPMMGFVQLALFAGYSIYFPELFPTRLRGTGVGFCYNTVRYLAAPGPSFFGWLSTSMGLREAAVTLSSIYFLGLVALIWAPETKDKPLPEEEPSLKNT